MANKTRNAKSWVASTTVAFWLVIAGSITLEAIGEYVCVCVCIIKKQTL